MGRWLVHGRRVLRHSPIRATSVGELQKLLTDSADEPAFFRNLSEDRLKRGVFKSVDELVAAIELFVLAHNETPKPFIWTKSAQDILQKVMRAKAKLKTVQTE